MRILVLATDVYGGHGGIALHNRNLCAALASYGPCDEVVVVPRLIRTKPEPSPARVKFIEEAAAGNAAYGRVVLKLLSQRSTFDLVVCGHIHLLPVARLFTPHAVLWIHGIDAWRRVPRAAPFIAKLRAVVSVSQLSLDRFAAWSGYRGETLVIPNAIRLEEYSVRPRDHDLARRFDIVGKTVLLTLGRIASQERYKGFDEVLDVLPTLVALRPDVIYMIAGDGDDMPRLQKKAADLGVAANVRFTGYVPEKDKLAIYQLADLFIMPSRGEGFGFVLLEAMACGIPVIASKRDGTREAMRNGALGRLVDPTNPAEILTAVLDVLATSGERHVPAGLEEFSFARFESRIHALLRELVPSQETRMAAISARRD